MFTKRLFNIFSKSLSHKLAEVEKEAERLKAEIRKVDAETNNTLKEIEDAKLNSDAMQTKVDGLKRRMDAYWQKKGK